MLAIQRQPGTNTVDVANQREGGARSSSQTEIPPSVTVIDALRPLGDDQGVGRRRDVHARADARASSSRVIFLFLRNWSATIIPSLALPMSIIGTFSVMYLLHYSLDNLSLMALTLAVGFVVDDAIVMLENIVRHLEMGKPKHAGRDRRRVRRSALRFSR